jgi:hypothetical protein
MRKGAKVFSQVRIAAAEAEDAPEASPRRDERARAAAYLDLWERKLTRLAVHGLDPARRPPA